MTIEQLNTADRFAHDNGIALVSVDEVSAVATMTVSDQHLNGAGVCQGGALFTLADLAAAGLTRGEMLTIDSDIRFLRAAKSGDVLTARATYLSQGGMPLIETQITDATGRSIAIVLSRFYQRK